MSTNPEFELTSSARAALGRNDHAYDSSPRSEDCVVQESDAEQNHNQCFQNSTMVVKKPVHSNMRSTMSRTQKTDWL